MDKLDALIKRLQEAKEELAKASKKKPSDEDAYAPVPAKDMPEDKKLQGSPKAGIPPAPMAKNVNMSYSKQPNVATGSMTGALERAEGETKHDRCAREVKEKSPDVRNPHAVCVSAGVEPDAWKKSHDEYLTLFKNGQWELKKDSVNPKLAPKDRKVKELQTKIDAGTYKPDAGKIAEKMLQSGAIKKEEDGTC